MVIWTHSVVFYKNGYEMQEIWMYDLSETIVSDGQMSLVRTWRMDYG